MIQNGSTVKVHYTGRLLNGQQFDSSHGKDPFEFTVGSQQVIPGFENGLIGRTIGEKFTITIPVEEAYGAKREDLYIKVDNSQLPGPAEVGQRLQGVSNGQIVIYTVKEVNEDHVILDGNELLAGEALIFDIEVMEVV
ncbi:peptidylprolyl isomerase [bacterium]|nr:peptidylprolyl isomerase [bacterium]